MSSWFNAHAQDRKELIEIIPDEIPVLPLRNAVVYPFSVVPLTVGIPRSVQLVEEAMEDNRLVGLAAMQDPSIEEPGPNQVHPMGTVALIHRVIQDEEGNLSILVQGIERFKVDAWTQTDPYLKARIFVTPDILNETVEIEALRRSLIEISAQLVQLIPQLPDEAIQFIDQIQDPRLLTYMIAANTPLELAEAQEILEIDHLTDKMRQLIAILTREVELRQLGHKIQEEAKGEIDKAQREYFLRQQLQAIRRELGETNETQAEVNDYRQKIEEADLPEEAEKEALRELQRMEKMPPQAAEYSVIKTYLDWLTDLPWNAATDDNLDVAHAQKVLDQDHYGLDDVKDRILEFLAVRKLRQERQGELDPTEDEELANLHDRPNDALGAILCFVGPPGVGKTSLGRSIARALERQFTRMSLGGMRDEAEIRGHRRTYIGAMPGRIIQALKRAGSKNPVFMLDEVDKIGTGWRGDPSSALLEVLDPQQNHAFRDHYLDVDFDLSQVLFIATANTLDTVPAPLRDRMEVIRLDGYTEYDKIHIARDYLIPRQLRQNGLRPGEIEFAPDGLRRIIRDYTREAGVRQLEREIGRVSRKVATQIATEQSADEQATIITDDIVRELLGKPRYRFEAALRTERPGVATGLAWTPTGGEVLFVEAAAMPGKNNLILTGHLGDVMKESARIALSFVEAYADSLSIPSKRLENRKIHLHVPAGAVPKDGPSAGVTMVTAMVSLLTGRRVRSDVGMTGEVSLLGQVLPIGGVKQKALSAHRAGLKTAILPALNEADLDDIPDDVRQEIDFVLVEDVTEVLQEALEPAPKEKELADDFVTVWPPAN